MQYSTIQPRPNLSFPRPVWTWNAFDSSKASSIDYTSKKRKISSPSYSLSSQTQPFTPGFTTAPLQPTATSSIAPGSSLSSNIPAFVLVVLSDTAIHSYWFHYRAIAANCDVKNSRAASTIMKTSIGIQLCRPSLLPPPIS